MDDKYDIVLFGATGFTGLLIAQYLDSKAKTENIKWAIAGRDTDKLKNIQASLLHSQPDIITADIKNSTSIDNMTSKTKILMNAVGPFNLYGREVVKSCINKGTHYIDITGEPSFVADLYNNYFESAVKNKTCVINCCGFDSIPADFAAWLTAKKLPKNEPKALKGYIRTNATFSGGTLTTAIQALYKEVQKESIKTKIRKHPDAPKIALRLHYSKDINAWAIPMPVVDPHIVKRSAFRLAEEYGDAVSYGQFFVRSSIWKILKTILPIMVAMILVRFKSFRDSMFKKFKPGTGPSVDRRAKTNFQVTCFGSSTTAKAKTIFSGGDPGYNETAKMFSQSAFTLLDKIKDDTVIYGILTPVEGLGNSLLIRLKKEGIMIE